VAARPQHRLNGDRYYLILAIAFLVVLGTLGGASRADELQQTFVRCAAIAVIAAALWPLNWSAFGDARGPVIGMALAYILFLAQLVPLPPEVWGRMPGHDIYLALAQQTEPLVWRPWTVSPDLTLNALGALLPATAIGLLTLALDFRARLLLARVIVAIACVSAVLGLLQFAAGGTSLHLFRTTSEDSAVGLFANRNHQAVFMACAVPMAAAIASIRSHREGASRRRLAIAAITSALLLMGLAATGSRMGLLLGSCGVGAAAAVHFVTRSAGEAVRSVGTRLSLAAAGLAIIAITAVSLLVWRSGAALRLASDPIDRTRVAALGPMLQAARTFFPFGAGFGTFDPVYRRFEPDSLLSTIYLNQAHNEPVQFAIEGGAVAILLLLLFVIWWAQAAVRALRRTESTSRRALAMAMAAATLILMLSSLVDYPLRTPLLSGLFAMASVELIRGRRRSMPSPAG
jgi:hypothetical protein